MLLVEISVFKDHKEDLSLRVKDNIKRQRVSTFPKFITTRFPLRLFVCKKNTEAALD